MSSITYNILCLIITYIFCSGQRVCKNISLAPLGGALRFAATCVTAALRKRRGVASIVGAAKRRITLCCRGVNDSFTKAAGGSGRQRSARRASGSEPVTCASRLVHWYLCAERRGALAGARGGSPPHDSMKKWCLCFSAGCGILVIWETRINSG